MTSPEPMVPVRYVGPAQRGIVIGASRVYPHPRVEASDPELGLTSEVEVLEHVALALVERGDFEPVGWEPPAPPTTDDDDGDDSAEAGGAFPVHRGGGSWELSDGSSVRGREAAVAAQAELDQAAASGETSGDDVAGDTSGDDAGGED